MPTNLPKRPKPEPDHAKLVAALSIVFFVMVVLIAILFGEFALQS
jgi:hypothetical protein